MNVTYPIELIFNGVVRCPGSLAGAGGAWVWALAPALVWALAAV